MSCPSGVPAPGFVGRFGDVVDERRASTFQELRSAELLNRSSDARMPFGWTVNPYRGCEIGCRYCYARTTHEYLGHVDPQEFEEHIYVKRADGAALLSSLRRARDSGQEIALGTATDPYQPAEGRFRITRGVLEAMTAVSGLRVGLTTKSTLVTRDLDLLTALARTGELTVHVSLISLDAELLRLLEPRAPRPDLRLGAIRTLAAAGLRTRLFVMPVLPFITDGAPGLRELLAAAAAAGAHDAAWNVLYLRGSVRPFFLDVVAREFPWAAERYRALFREGSSAQRAYRDALDRRLESLCREVGFAGRRRERSEPAPAPAARPRGRPRQLALHWE